MASQGVAAISRLEQMQMRFQQKQMQEREQRRIEMTGGVSAGSEGAAPKNIGNGKVRQMFDERRRGAGIDRSNPLKPIATTTSISTSKAAVSSGNINILSAAMASRGSPTLAAANTRSRPQPPTVSPKRQVHGRHGMIRSETFEQSVANGNVTARAEYDEVDNLDNETFPKGFSSLSLNENSRISGDRNANNSSSGSTNYNDTYGRIKSSNSIKLNPVVTKKSPSVSKSRSHVRHATPAPSPGSSATASRSPPAPTRSSMRSTPEKPSTVRIAPKSSTGKMAGPAAKVVNGSAKPPPRIITPPAGMATCRICQRHFNEDRLAKHEEVCKKMATSKRRVFDATKHRLKGTDAEKYVKKPTRGGAAAASSAHISKQHSTYSSAAAAAGMTMPPKKSNWRKKHEEFIAAIRAAKQVSSHLAKGGKLSDLPPPPPSENADYIQCPHCSRRFNQAAAERHIPRCATMMHNKPKLNIPAKKR